MVWWRSNLRSLPLQMNSLVLETRNWEYYFSRWLLFSFNICLESRSISRMYIDLLNSCINMSRDGESDWDSRHAIQRSFGSFGCIGISFETRPWKNYNPNHILTLLVTSLFCLFNLFGERTNRYLNSVSSVSTPWKFWNFKTVCHTVFGCCLLH